GREDELARLHGALGRLRDGHGGIVGVFAEAGLGKSRLLAEVAASDDARGVAWGEGRSVSPGRHRGFHSIIDLCRSLVGIDEKDDAQRALAKLTETIRGLLPDEIDEVLPFIASLLGLEIDASARARMSSLQGDAMEKLTLRSVTQLLRERS